MRLKHWPMTWPFHQKELNMKTKLLIASLLLTASSALAAPKLSSVNEYQDKYLDHADLQSRVVESLIKVAEVCAISDESTKKELLKKQIALLLLLQKSGQGLFDFSKKTEIKDVPIVAEANKAAESSFVQLASKTGDKNINPCLMRTV
jgi:hypothetical protein